MKIIFNSIILLIILLISTRELYANNYYAEVPLNSKWNFSIGDNHEWAKVNFDDADWDRIYVPSRWEDEGYEGYNGYAWYRKKINIPESFKNRTVYLELGYIDDVDEVFFNGEKIGQSGTFPPKFSSAYNSFRKYQVPANLIKINEVNVIAVRTFDSQLEGGIVRGNVRLVADKIAIIPDISLNGYWHFNLGSELKMGNDKIMVPGAWENFGYNDYNGFAVYSRIVNIPDPLAKTKLIFMAGRIDDDDQLFINGQLIGSTGDVNRKNNTDMHREFRNYFIPDGVIKPGNNLVYIRVVDRSGEGGILEGNIGFISQENFIKFWKMKRK